MSILATDNFDRGDEIPVAAPWVTGTGNATFNLISDALMRGDQDTDAWAYYDGSISWPNDQYSKAKITTPGSGGANQGIGLCVRKASGLTNTLYRLVIDHAATNNCALHWMDAGTQHVVTQFTQAWTDGDTWELRAVGTTLSMWLNGGQVGGDQTDSNITSGFPGAAYSSAAGFCGIDDWEGGSVGGGPVVDKRGRFWTQLLKSRK